MAHRSILRASDSDREQVTERLRKAASEGRLLAEELEQRLEAALTARTYGELDRLVADLPAEQAVVPRSRSAAYLKRPAMVLAAVVLVAALLAAVALVITGTIIVGGAWLFLGFWFFGGRGCRHRGYGRHPQRYRGSAGFVPWL